jgi:hypothetical protein
MKSDHALVFLPFARSGAEPVPTAADRALKQKNGPRASAFGQRRGANSPLMPETKDPRRNHFTCEPPAPPVSPRASLAGRIVIAA